MELSLIRSFAPALHIERDGSFESAGFDLRRPLPGMLTYAGSAAFLADCSACESVSAIVTTQAAYDESVRTGRLADRNIGLAFSPRPRTDFFLFHNYLAERTSCFERPFQAGIGQGCTISPTARLDRTTVRLGDRVVIGEGVTLGKHVVIGDDTVVWPGSVLGNDGFQFERLEGRPIKIAHVGGVVIGKNVEIKSNCCVDRHIFNADTRIGDHTKLDNLVYVGHCTQIGRACLLGAHASITGSVLVGDDVWIGPNATISSAITIGSGALISLGSVVTRDVPPGQRVSGNFAITHERFLHFLRQIR